MAKPISDNKSLTILTKPPSGENIFRGTVDKILTKKSNNNLLLAKSVAQQTPSTEVLDKPSEIPPKLTELPAPNEEATTFPEKGKAPSPFLPPKSVSHSPKISPSSIPNPSPSVTTNKHVELGYPNYGGYLYSIPGYSAFQPVANQGLAARNLHTNTLLTQNNDSKTEFVPFPSKIVTEIITDKLDKDSISVETPKTQTDFEDHFTPEIVPAVSEVKISNESKLNISSLAQSSGAMLTTTNSIHEMKSKQTERFSLKTSIPISKIDMKCVNTVPDAVIQNNVVKKPSQPFNSAFQSVKDTISSSRVEIQSNIIIKTAENTEMDSKAVDTPPPVTCMPNNSISTLINAAEAISSSDTQFWKSEPGATEVKDSPFAKPLTTTRPIFNPLNAEPKCNFNKTSDGFSEQKNQILFIQNKNPSNQKMLLAISQQQSNPPVLLQRTNVESKNMQAPSRLSVQNNKCDDDNIPSKVVALKRLHQENCDENDFENLITENQIYGNKIVVKEKTQGTSQEQDLKSNFRELKGTNEKLNQTPDSKNLVLQPNFLYLSNVQFPTNLMMIKNAAKSCQSLYDPMKTNIKCEYNETKSTNETNPNTCDANALKSNKNQVSVSKDVHILKSNNVLQTLTQTNNNKTDLMFHTNQKVIMNPQILYQVPMLVDTDGISNNNVQKINAPSFMNKDYTTFLTQNKKDITKTMDTTKPNDKLYIACPYQMDSKLQPKIVITNIRPKVTTRLDETSTLDLYEKRKRIRRLKYLTNRDPKSDIKKEKSFITRNIITPDKMKAEIYKEFAKSKIILEGTTSDSESDYEEKELKEYKSIIDTYGVTNYGENRSKRDFLFNFSLATHDEYKEKIMDRQERSLLRDAVAAAYIAVDRIDRIAGGQTAEESTSQLSDQHTPLSELMCNEETDTTVLQKKQAFLSKLHLVRVSSRYKEDYEKTWQQIVKERRKRNCVGVPEVTRNKLLTKQEKMALNTKNQLQILIDIKKSVNENNNLIKKRLDAHEVHTNDDSIHMLAERNFSELSKLSIMADRSVKLFSGQDTRKRDLTPGFDSENIIKQEGCSKPKQPFKNYPNINIPNISKIISLKSSQEVSSVNTTPATSMDEPQNSAAGLRDDRLSMELTLLDNVREAVHQPAESTWPGVEAVIKSYRHFENNRRRSIADHQRRNTQLRAESVALSRAASAEAERARPLLAERQALAADEHNAKLSLHKLINAIEFITNYHH